MLGITHMLNWEKIISVHKRIGVQVEELKEGVNIIVVYDSSDYRVRARYAGRGVVRI